MSKYLLVIKNSNEAALPIWRFISGELQTDKIMNIPIEFKTLVMLADTVTVDNEHNEAMFSSDNLWSLTELMAYIIKYHRILSDASYEFTEELVTKSKIYVFDDDAHMNSYIACRLTEPIISIDLSFKNLVMDILPDHPYYEYWADKYLSEIHLTVSENSEPDDSIFINILDNVTTERIKLSFNKQMDANVIREMFHNTKCRIVECEFKNCDSEYRLTIAPFANIDFRYQNETKYFGIPYVSCVYERENTKDDERTMVTI